ERPAAARDERLLYSAARQLADQELGLPLAASIPPGGVDVDDLRGHRPKRARRVATAPSVAQLPSPASAPHCGHRRDCPQCPLRNALARRGESVCAASSAELIPA